MSPIQSITAPDPRKGSRRYNPEDARIAADVLLEGGHATDGERYDSEGGARSSGTSLKNAIEALTDSGVDFALRVRVWGSEGDEGFQFAVTPRPESSSDSDGGINPERYTHKELDALAADNDVDDYPEDGTKADKADALNSAGVGQDEPDENEDE